MEDTRSSLRRPSIALNVCAGPPAADLDPPPKAGVAPFSSICCRILCGSSPSRKKSGSKVLPATEKTLGCEMCWERGFGDRLNETI